MSRSSPVFSAVIRSALVTVAAAAPALAGPDITHQEIQDTSNYGQSTSVPGIYGYAWGSYTCNIGDASLSWVSGGTPALAMNAYRLSDGRLVQIGIGYAKHACCVGNGVGCGTCSTAGFGLRPGCRDIYGAGFNGGQTRLGPRSGINAFDGSFTAIPAGSGDATWRRVQIHRDQMSATSFPNAIFFAEGVYVCAEEEPAQQLNNATYRRMTVANTGTAPTYAWTVAAGAASMAGLPAIYAWQAHGNGVNTPDPSVQIVTADVLGEGRFYVAAKPRDLGNGTWRYDYAVFNLNSHRSGGGFSVSVPLNATVTDIGFNSPPYHSGEIYDNTTWSGAKVGTAVVWNSPATFAVNPNTNALRWGTMYNFWFTANVPPAANGGAALRLFRPGTPSELKIEGIPAPALPRPADFNQNGIVSVQDVFDFVGAYFAADPRADFNHAGGIDVQDIFDFLEAFFSA